MIKNSPNMPALQSHTHCQAAQSIRTSQSLSKSVSFPTHGRQKRKHDCTTACIRNSGFSGKSKVSAFNKSQCQYESEVLFNPLLIIHAKRYKQFKNSPLHILFMNLSLTCFTSYLRINGNLSAADKDCHHSL